MSKTKAPSGLHLWLVLHKAHKEVEHRARMHIDTLCLCMSDFAVMEVLLHKGPMRVNDIGDKVLLTSGSITTAVQRLEKIGYLRRLPDPEDGRAQLIDLNDIGRQFINYHFDGHEYWMEKAAKCLSDDERRQLEALLKKWGQTLEAEHKEP